MVENQVFWALAHVDSPVERQVLPLAETLVVIRWHVGAVLSLADPLEARLAGQEGSCDPRLAVCSLRARC